MDHAYRVPPGHRVNLSEQDPADTKGLSHKAGDKELVDLGERLTALQEVHYAAAHNGILIVLQGLDTAGKDGTIRQVLARFNPAGCRVESFKVPTPVEAAHDFLWRAHLVTPPLGMITVFNRSHYEDVLVTRVHQLVPKAVWEPRYQHINNFEALLAESGTIILKFFLHISKHEQQERLLAREHDKERAWKLSTSDWPEHARYDDYVRAYEDALARCSTDVAPWYIVPSDHKWFRNLAVAWTILDVLEPFQRIWRKELEQRGQEALAACAAQREAGHAP